MKDEKFIEHFQINIGQPGFGFGDVFIQFHLNKKVTTCRLEDFKNATNIIWESNGNRSDEAHKAKKLLDSIFMNLFRPYLLDKPKITSVD